MNKTRPVYLDLTKIRMPLAAIVSILHRASGFVLFLVIPYLLILWNRSLSNAEAYDNLQLALQSNITRGVIYLILLALLYHWVAGIRHLLMDMGIGEDKISGRRGAILVLAVVVLLALMLGV
ncbi:MAG: succinate dehydrogenase, cytochrome b556 subunit, partial [Gammaproteobacteria bacterium]|nr:succinate dehydrogenase, cytochrome b556 subunit [Gammaproteobacteria bacterium]